MVCTVSKDLAAALFLFKQLTSSYFCSSPFKCNLRNAVLLTSVSVEIANQNTL